MVIFWPFGEVSIKSFSPLKRARIILKKMLTRAAGDTCVRVLAILVICAVVVIIIVEAVKPGAIARSIDGWF